MAEQLFTSWPSRKQKIGPGLWLDSTAQKSACSNPLAPARPHFLKVPESQKNSHYQGTKRQTSQPVGKLAHSSPDSTDQCDECAVCSWASSEVADLFQWVCIPRVGQQQTQPTARRPYKRCGSEGASCLRIGFLSVCLPYHCALLPASRRPVNMAVRLILLMQRGSVIQHPRPRMEMCPFSPL